MTLGPIPDYLKNAMRDHFLSGLKDNHSLEIYELDLFRWFRSETEETWGAMNAEEQKYLQEQVASGVDEINDTGVLAVAYYRTRMRSSHVIFLATLLESAMKRECQRLTIALSEKVMFNPSELKGDPWSARKLFLERHASFQICSDLWNPINDLLSVRNAFVHHGGDVTLLTAEQISRLQKIPDINVDNSEIQVGVNYIDYASEAVKELMQFIHKKTNSVIDCAIKQKVLG